MFFSEDFVNHVMNNPYVGITEACDQVTVILEQSSHTGWVQQEHEMLMDAAAFINYVIIEKQFDMLYFVPELTGIISDDCKLLYDYIKNIKSQFGSYALKIKMQSYAENYSNLFKGAFSYEFSKGDLDRIQALINELRQYIYDNESLEEKHRQRLLKRLENLQAELHKRVSDLDRFWGLVGDAGVVLGKLGNDAKPIVDRIKEIAEIAWKTQARTEELPSSSTNPMLNNVD
ncbi:TPA: hypothetical protein ACSP10_002169 [Aeromonas veronii]